jgi:hypothetical protein
MIRKPPAGWNREKAPVVAARRAAEVAGVGVSAGRGLIYFIRAGLFGVFALIWGWAGLAAGLIGGSFPTLIGAGGAAVLMGWLAKRDIDRALGRG